MMYKVFFDPDIDGWSLSDFECAGSPIDARIFTYGLTQTPTGPLSVNVKEEGPALDFSFDAWSVPVVTRRVGEVFAHFAPDAVQRFPVEVGGIAHQYEVLNVIRVVDAVDRERSKYLLWKPEDNRPDKLGEFRDFDRLVLKKDLPPNLHTFRIQGWKVWVVSPALKAALEEAGCRGAIFRPIEQ